jgi:hypothetical protein
MAVVFAENPNGTAQSDPVDGKSGFITSLQVPHLINVLDEWKDLCPVYNSSRAIP